MKFKNKKTTIVGMNGTGKTEFAKYLARNVYERPAWVLVNEDDYRNMPKNVLSVLLNDTSGKELNQTLGTLFELAKENKIDAVVVDELDLFATNDSDLDKYPNLNKFVVLQRHSNVALVGVGRRPARIPTTMFETSDNIIIYPSLNSDNTEKKLKSLHRELPEMHQQMRKGDYRYIAFEPGHEPKLKNPIPLGTKKKKTKGGKK